MDALENKSILFYRSLPPPCITKCLSSLDLFLSASLWHAYMLEFRGKVTNIGIPRTFEPVEGSRCKPSGRLPEPLRDRATLRRAYKWLQERRYTCHGILKLGSTFFFLQAYLLTARHILFLIAAIPTIVHTTRRGCQPCNLTCKHKRPNIVFHTEHLLIFSP